MFELPEIRPESDSSPSQNSFLRGDWPNNDIICPTGPVASLLKWGKIQLYNAQKVKYGIDSIFWQRFRAPRDLSIAGWDQEKKSEKDFFFILLGAKKKNFPLFIKRKSLP